jgi:predicted dehydrogenase
MKKTYSPALSRRSFLKRSVAFGAVSFLPAYIALGNQSSTGTSPSRKINLAAVGIGHQGARVITALHTSGLCNVVALCDVDLQGEHTQKTIGSFPKAKQFTDFRKMFDAMEKEIDAVVIATPDHSHFAATILAMSLGKHVFVEKPLAHTFGQCERLLTKSVANPELVTQMGNQGHSGAAYFQHQAFREAGLLDNITRVTAYMNMGRRWHGWGTDAATYPEEAMPSGIDWDQWHDLVDANRPFSSKLHPQEWRSWFEFGSGAFGDWGPHVLDMAHRFLELGLPDKVTPVALAGRNVANLIYPQASTIRFHFPARGPGLPACDVTWYDGVDNIPEVEPELGPLEQNSATGESERMPYKIDPKNGPGTILYSNELVLQRGAKARPLTVLPKDKYMEMRRSLPRFPQKNSNHYENFLLACLGEEESRSPFSISAPLAQVFNLGMIAQRLGEEVQFDQPSKQVLNNKPAQALLDPAPRKGWEEFYTL